jgi:hypothetical protein
MDLYIDITSVLLDYKVYTYDKVAIELILIINKLDNLLRISKGRKIVITLQQSSAERALGLSSRST